MSLDEDYMREALKEAEIALKERNIPIGCVIVMDNKIISRAHNQIYTLKDRLAHAETLALKNVQKELYDNKKQATVYTTYEPCPMCIGAIMLSRIKKVVYGVDLDNSGAISLLEHFPKLFQRDKWKLEYTPGILAQECKEVFMKSWFAKDMAEKGLLKNI
jgi:tRNA(adenine34) deaminase